MKCLHWIVLLLACVVSAGPVDVCTTGRISDTVRISLVAGGGSVSTSLGCYFSDGISTPEISHAVLGVVSASMAGTTLTLTPAAYVQSTAPLRDTVTLSATVGTTTETVDVIVDVTSCVKTASASTVVLEPGGTLVTSIAEYFTYDDVNYSEHEALTYTAASSAPATFTVSLEEGDMTLTGGTLPEGTNSAEAELSLTATNSCGTAAGTVAVEVVKPTPPVVDDPLPDVTVAARDTVYIYLPDHFRSPGGHTITYSTDLEDHGPNVAYVGVTKVGAKQDSLQIVGLDAHPKEDTDGSELVVEARNVGGSVSETMDVRVTPVPPEVIKEIPDTELASGGAAAHYTLSEYFADPDGAFADLDFVAVSSNPDAVTTSIADGVLTVTPGTVTTETTATITVTAEDEDELSASDDFVVTVSTANRAPTCNPIAVTLTVNDADEELDMDDYCSDPDNDDLTYELGDVSGSSASITLVGNDLTISPLQVGLTRATVTADDGNDNTADSEIKATVSNLPPRKKGTMSAIVVHPDDDDKEVEVVDYFSDPENEALVYTASSSSSSVVTVSMGTGDNAGTLTLSDYSIGSSTVTVTATDPHKAKVDQEFEFSAVCSVPTSSTIPNQFVLLDADAEIALDDYFSDPRNEELSYTATRTGVLLTLDISDENTLTIEPETVGSATVAITAENACGGTSARRSFGVTVRGKPVASGSIPNQSLVVGGAVKTLDVSDYFSEPDGDTVTYSARITTLLPRIPDYVSVRMSGSTLTMDPGSTPGRINVEVTATDRDGSATQTFTVSVAGSS